MFFIVFKRLSSVEKIKIWWKIADTSLNMEALFVDIYYYSYYYDIFFSEQIMYKKINKLKGNWNKEKSVETCFLVHV